MNWLAHLLISKPDIDYQLGNLLADPLKGRCWPQAGELVREGFAMHREIDKFTDAHVIVARSKLRFGEKAYLRAVVVDIVYDHLLVSNWEKYCVVGFEQFVEQFNDHARRVVTSYPERAEVFIRRLLESGHLMSYSHMGGVQKALQRIDQRLSSRLRAKDSAGNYLPVIERELGALQRDFLEFFPQLITHFLETSGIEADKHWLRRQTRGN